MSRRALLHSVLLMTFMFVSKAGANEVKVIFDSPIEVSIPSLEGLTKQTTYPAGKEVPFAASTIFWVQSKGRVPLLVIPTSAVKSQDAPRIKLPEIAVWPPQAVEQEIERKVSLMIEDIQNFQAAVARKDLAEADQILTRMESVHAINYLNFLRASLSFIKGDLTSARIYVERGLQRSPANVQGQRLLRALEGKKP